MIAAKLTRRERVLFSAPHPIWNLLARATPEMDSTLSPASRPAPTASSHTPRRTTVFFVLGTVHKLYDTDILVLSIIAKCDLLTDFCYDIQKTLWSRPCRLHPAARLSNSAWRGARTACQDHFRPLPLPILMRLLLRLRGDAQRVSSASIASSLSARTYPLLQSRTSIIKLPTRYGVCLLRPRHNSENSLFLSRVIRPVSLPAT